MTVLQAAYQELALVNQRLRTENDRFRADLNHQEELLNKALRERNDWMAEADRLRAEVAELQEALREFDHYDLDEPILKIVEGLRAILAKTQKEEDAQDSDPSDPEYDAMWDTLPGKKCPTCHTTDPYGHEPGCEWLHETPWIARTQKERE